MFLFLKSVMDSGSSGGAIFSMKGEMVAMNQGGDKSSIINDTIPINDIKPLIDKLK